MATKIKSSNITNDAISEEHIDVTAITGNPEIAASAAADDVLLIYDTSSGTIKKIQASRVGMVSPSITSISPTNVLTGDGTGNHTFVVTGTRFTADSTANLIKTGGATLAFSSVTRNSSTQLTCVIAKSSMLTADEPFDIKVTTEGGLLSATKTDQVTVDASPVFVTGAGSLGNVLESVAGSFSVNATDPESAGNVTFELQSGALPTGFTLVNTAAEGGTAIIAGTHAAVAAHTTYNFVLRAVDAASNTTSRAFSITINNNPVTTSFTASGTFSVPAGASVYDVLVVAGGGGANSQTPHPTHRSGSGGGGAGGLIFMPEYPVTASGTITVTVGAGGPREAGQDSVFGAPGDPGLGQGGVLTAKGGGGGGDAYQNPGGHQNGRPGGSGGGNSGGSVGTATQPTQPGNSGSYGFGNNGGSGSPGSGGGGGGAGASGGSSQPGGVGKAYTIADGTTSVYYAGGGGAGPSGTGGQGGGANGPMGAGQANKGGGAGGSSSQGQGTSAGGKGIVIVRG